MKKLKLGLLGRDVSGSESERMHRFILSAQGAACDYENVSAGAEEFVPAVKRLLRETDGFNVTIPYKREIFQYLKSIEGDAAEFGSVNTVISATRTGFNTDGAGFMMMRSGAGLAAEGRTALVVGAGGAGRSTAAGWKRAAARRRSADCSRCREPVWALRWPGGRAARRCLSAATSGRSGSCPEICAP